MPNSKRLTPDASEEERDSPRNANSNDTEESSPPIAAGRRDENSISFRHFLQPQSDVVSTRHRNPRGPHSGAVDLVDVAMALPDFVQDHLVVESIASADHPNASNHSNHTNSPLDLSVLNEILPDYASSQRNLSVMANGNRRRNFEDNGLSCSNNADVSLAQGQGVALPDFLSDGPMHCSNNDNLTSSSSSRGISCRNSNLASENRIDDSHRSSSFDGENSLPQQIERLRRDLAEKSRRVNQLEAELMRQRNESDLVLRTSEQSIADVNRRATEAERRVTQLSRENSQLKDQLCDSSSQRSDSVAANIMSGPSTSNGLARSEGSHNINANAVLNFARTSEALVSQLMDQIKELRTAAASSLDETKQPDDASDKKDSY